MPKQILLADDSITIQKVIALTFAGEDYKIIAVDNGADAVTKARELKPDIVLADVVMPQKTGYEVCEALKSDPELKNIPVLLLAGTFEPFDEEVARKAGSDGFIIKPFESQALIQKVRDLISVRPAGAAAPVPRPAVPTPPAAAPTPIPVTPPSVAPPVPMASKPPVVPAAAPIPSKPRYQPAPSSAPVPPAVKPPQPSEEDFWGTMMEEVEEKKPPKIEPQVVQPKKEEVREEEVWDMGEFEEKAPAAAAAEEEVWETFAFEEAEAEGAGDVLEAPAEVPEEEFSFVEEMASEVAEEEVEEIQDIGFEEAPAEETFGVLAEEPVEEEEFVFSEEVPEVSETPVQIVPQSEILQGYEQTFEPEAISQKLPAAPSQKTVAATPASAEHMPEEQLRAALGQVSREVIEKIVWEIVPDLAEMLIKEEIKRLQKK